MELEGLGSNEKLSPRQFSMFCFGLMDRFHWTYDEVMNIPIPIMYSLIEYLNKTQQEQKW